MSMNVVSEQPPNIDAIRAVFGPLPDGTVFAWGDTIYAPGASYKDIGPDLMVHETVHRVQQEAIGGPEAWWERYLDDPQFRLEQEIEAYRAQIAFFPDRARRREARRLAAKALSSPMYGRIITKDEAMRALSLAYLGQPA